MAYQCSLLNDLRGGDHHKRTTQLAGVPHDERCLEAADEIERLRGALVRIQDLTQYNMGMSARDETCVWHEATKALKEPEA